MLEFIYSINRDKIIKNFRIQWSKSTPVHVPNMYKDIAPAYIEVGSGSFQVRNCCFNFIEFLYSDYRMHHH